MNSRFKIGLDSHLPAFCLCSVVILLCASTGFAQPARAIGIVEFVQERLANMPAANEKRVKFSDICPISTDKLAARIFSEYGAIFVASDSVMMPSKCVFESEAELAIVQKTMKTKTAVIGGVTVELQEAAMEALLAAIKESDARGLRITPRGGATASRRSFADTQRIWDSRFFPGLDHWIARGKISKSEANAARAMSIAKQVKRVLEWEAKGYFFSTGKDRTILSSVAAPGTSQHLSMLALDVAQFSDPAVREILNRHGWFQTVADDTPHFTFLGVPEAELSQRGLILKVKNGYKFWVPNFKQT